MANKKFTPEEIAILKANPYVREVTEDIIHFSASFKSSFRDRLQNGMKPPDIFRHGLRHDTFPRGKAFVVSVEGITNATR